MTLNSYTKALLLTGALGFLGGLLLIACGASKPHPDDLVRIGRACDEVGVTADLMADLLEDIMKTKSPNSIKMLAIDTAEAARRAENECFKDMKGSAL